MKLSSLHKTSGCVEPAGNEGDLGECDGACIAVATMPHIGQPGLGAKAMAGGRVVGGKVIR